MNTMIYLDDERVPSQSGYGNGWCIIRTVEGFKDLVNGLYESGWDVRLISFDHDLGEDENGHLLETGYDALKWWVHTYNPDPDEVEVRFHTANIIGRKNMEAFWNSWVKHWREQS